MKYVVTVNGAEHEVTLDGGRIVPVRRCERCGWTDLNPLVW